MRTLLAALLVPALAQAETPAPSPAPARPAGPVLRAGVPVSPAGAVQRPTAPAPPPGRALSGRPAGAPPAAAQPPAAPPAKAAAPVPPGAAGGTLRAEGACVPMQGRFLLAFHRADIVDVLEQASRWTCRNFVYSDDMARGKITLLSKTPVTPEEAYAAFLAALTSNGIAVYQTGRYWKLVRIADAKKTPIPTLLEDGSEIPAQEQPVTRLLRLRHADPDQLRAVLSNFTSPQGADIQVVQPDLLVVTDIGLNVRRIEKIIGAVDRPGATDLIRVIQVQYAAARDLADKINQIFVSAAPARPGTKRPVIGGLAAGVAPARLAPPPPPTVAEATEISITKVLADERTNKLIVIADEKSFQRILELVKQLDTPTAGEGTIHVVFLKNANAEEMAQTLQALAQGQATARRTPTAAAPVPGQPIRPQQPTQTTAELFSGEVKVTADKASNSLVILASGSDYAVMVRLIEKLDRPRRQVFVEAVLMEVNVSDESKLGVAMHTAFPVNTSQGKGFIPLGFEPGRINSLNPASALQLGGFLTGVVGPVSAELKDIFPFPSVAALIQALATSSDVNVLSTPHLLAQDNEESEIVVGQNVPFQAGYNPGFSTALPTTAGQAPSLGSLALASFVAPIQRQNVDLKLKIKPQIHEGDMVRLDLEEQAEEIVGRDPILGPTTAKRSVKTKIVAKDQTTVVIGGLIQDRIVRSVQKIPILGDIPLIGWLFRDTSTSKTKSNLLLFLTPYIIRDQSDYRRILERKQREQREFAELFYGQGRGYEVATDWDRKGGPFSKMRREVQTESQKFENGGPGAPHERMVGPSAPPSERPVRARQPDVTEPPAPRPEPTPPAPDRTAPPAPEPESPPPQ